MCVPKTKKLISCAVTVELICAFVYAHAVFWFSGTAAQMMVPFCFHLLSCCQFKKNMQMTCTKLVFI